MKVKNWSEFQHYKDRCPPWIKLHHELLDNYEFHCLPVASRALAPMLWLLASESKDGSLPCDLEKIAFRLHQTQPELVSALKPLITKGFLVVEQSDSELLAERKQSAVPETEAETYTQETEGEAQIQNQPPLNCARRLMEVLGLPQTGGFLRTVEAAIVAEAAYVDLSPADAAQQIASHASEARRRGLAIDKFYFEDTKWRNGNGNGAKRQVSAVEQRVSGNREVLADIARTITAQRVGLDGDERKDSTGTEARRGVRAGAV